LCGWTMVAESDDEEHDVESAQARRGSGGPKRSLLIGMAIGVFAVLVCQVTIVQPAKEELHQAERDLLNAEERERAAALALKREQLELRTQEAKAAELLAELQRMEAAEGAMELELRALHAEAEQRRREPPRPAKDVPYADDWIPHGLRMALPSG